VLYDGFKLSFFTVSGSCVLYLCVGRWYVLCIDRFAHKCSHITAYVRPLASEPRGVEGTVKWFSSALATVANGCDTLGRWGAYTSRTVALRGISSLFDVRMLPSVSQQDCYPALLVPL